MARLVRKHVYLTAEQDAFVKRYARELDVTEAAIVRQAIERLRPSNVARELDEQAWQEERAFIAERARLLVSTDTGQRQWTRDELYD